MIPVNVTIQYMHEGVKNSAVLRLSMDMTADEAVRGIVQYLHLPTSSVYRLLRQRQLIEPETRLFDASIQEGDIVQLTVVDSNTTLGTPGVGRTMAGGVMSRLGGHNGSDPLPVLAALIMPDGQPLYLQRTRALIGRADESLGYPADLFDVELTPFDPDRTISRPHAQIVYADGHFTIRDLHSQGGVRINNRLITLSQAQPIHNGDVIALGSVILEFRCEG